MTSARIRPAHGGDAPIIHDLQLACWNEAYIDHVPQSAFTELEETGLAHWQNILVEPEGVWIAHRDGQAVGFARAIAAGPGQVRPLELEKLYVLESEYGKGTAHNLLTMAIGDAPCQIWVADYNKRAQKFYAKAGFSYDGSEDARMEAPNVPGIMLHRMIR